MLSLDASSFRHFKSKFWCCYYRKALYGFGCGCNDIGQTLVVGSLKINSTDASVGKAIATLLADNLAFSLSADKLLLEEDSLVSVMALKKLILTKN
jgi:hypothetical protein